MRRHDCSRATRIRLEAREIVHGSWVMGKALRRQSLQNRWVPVSERQDGRGVALSRA